jgi:putative ABC transport system substrate-binding protein
LELLRELVLHAAIIAVLVNPKNPNADTLTRDAWATASAVGQHIHILHASTASEVEAAFNTLAQVWASTVLIASNSLCNSRNAQFTALEARHAVSAMYTIREFAAAGVLVSYGVKLADRWRQVDVYTGPILKGGKPADLPIPKPTKFEVVINLKTARAPGLEVPPTLLACTDEVIE